MFTIFFGGNQFAPNLQQIEGQSVQDYLVSHYLRCYQHLATRLKGVDAVIGFEAMNEPHTGYIGMETLAKFDDKKDLRMDKSPLPLESFALGMGECLVSYNLYLP
jgi:aryl-phospho-beta-D-glucosidase BglC (GH1 family)